MEKYLTGCALCYHSWGMEVTVDNGKVIQVEGQKDHPLNRGYLCPKGRAAIEYLYHPARLKYPLKKVSGSWEKVSWKQTLTGIAGKPGELSNTYDPSVNAFFCGSIGVENVEMVSLTQRFKALLKTPNYFLLKAYATG